MKNLNLILKSIKTHKAIIYEIQEDLSLFTFDGVEWSQLNHRLALNFAVMLQEIKEELMSEPFEINNTPKGWKGLVAFEGVDYHIKYVQELKILRISRIPHRQATLEDWGFAENQIKSLSQPGQISLIVGPQGSGKSTVQKLLYRHANEVGSRPRFTVGSESVSNPRQWFFLDSKEYSPEQVISLSFKGQSIAYTFESLDLETALLLFFREIPERLQARLITHLTVIETRLLPGIEQLVVPFSSFYQLRYCPAPMIERQDWSSLITWQEGQKDQFNVRTLNQVLLQGVLKRKIDMKTAFAASAHPEGLDHMLRRIGV